MLKLFLKTILATSLLSLVLINNTSCTSSSTNSDNDNESLTRFVDPKIGSGGHGHVFVGANVPFGAIQLGPTSVREDWDWTSGYHDSDTTVIGFSHTHLSGTGIGDLADVTMMPVVGQPTYARGVIDDPNSGLWSYFHKKSEEVSPGYYSCFLSRYGIKVELTATKYVGMHKYTFPASNESAVVVDLENGTCWDETTDCNINQKDAFTLIGHRFSTGWANNQKEFFVIKFSKKIKNFSKIIIDSLPSNAEKKLYGRVDFDTKKGETIYAKVALSAVSIANAEKNLASDSNGWDFEKMKASADAQWNEALSKVKIETSNIKYKRIFYTAMYHAMMEPSLYSDVNGEYRGADDGIHQDLNHNKYTTYSLWDTYRAENPLLSIIQPDRFEDMVCNMVDIFNQQGKLPVWHLMANETNCMVGNSAIPVVADAILKGFKNIDIQNAYDAMKTTSMLDERGLKYLKQYGYIPYDKYNESVATCMEYNIDDWALGQVALKLGYKEDADYFINRSYSYRKYFDPSTGFMTGLSSKGVFRKNINPFESEHRMNDYTEGNAWQYTWLAPHDVPGLVNLFGSKENFLTKLDSLFVVKGSLGKNASPDISGLIGQYAHGNEPSHHIAYLYAMVGQPRSTALRVRQILTTLYTDQPNGLSGNEDAGQMSAWYILSSIGFYQVEPAGGRYYFGSPLFDKVTIDVGNGKVFVIKVQNNNSKNIYLGKITLNGEPYNKGYIDYKDIMAGGILDINMIR